MLRKTENGSEHTIRLNEYLSSGVEREPASNEFDIVYCPVYDVVGRCFERTTGMLSSHLLIFKQVLTVYKWYKLTIYYV